MTPKTFSYMCESCNYCWDSTLRLHQQDRCTACGEQEMIRPIKKMTAMDVFLEEYKRSVDKVLTIADGKYTLILDKNGVIIGTFRRGRNYRDVVGDNLIFHLTHQVIELQAALEAEGYNVQEILNRG